MKYNQLGNTGLFVSEICLGTMTFGGQGMFKVVGELDLKGATGLVSRALESGVNFLDTADVYSVGNSEKLTGQALKDIGVKRSDVVIATKCYGRTGAGPNDMGASRGHIMDAVAQSLERLNTDHIDLYQIHGNDVVTPVEETMRALDDLMKQGKVRAIGCSNFSAAELDNAQDAAARAHASAFVTVQDEYSLLARDIERGLIPAMAQRHLSLLPYFPLASGLLTGKYRRYADAPKGARLSYSAHHADVLNEKNWAKLDKLNAVAERTGHSLLEFAFGWLLAKPIIGSVIAGATKPEQIEQNVAAAAKRPSPAVIAEIDAITA
jgi:aryl-alcohol dehydrogenase-like predicted oxidoreductase